MLVEYIEMAHCGYCANYGHPRTQHEVSRTERGDKILKCCECREKTTIPTE